MPAIIPARLKQQAAILADQFDEPPVYVRSLHHLLETYAERASRPGQAGEPPPLLQSYKVRPPVLRQILLELIPLAHENPQGALAICDALWEQPVLEFRLLSARLLGQIQCETPSPVIGRLKDWIKPDVEQRLLDELFSGGTNCLRQNNAPAMLELARGWMEEKDLFYQQLGLRVLLNLVNEPSYENLPVFYRLLQPFIRSVPARLRPDVLDLIAALARRSPSEMVYFLRQTVVLPNSPDAPYLIRQSLHQFPSEQEEELRILSRQISERRRKGGKS